VCVLGGGSTKGYVIFMLLIFQIFNDKNGGLIMGSNRHYIQSQM